MIIISLLIWLLAVIVAITIHEFAHALAADKLGDPTPSLQKRLSLNPLNHYDQVGTTMLILTAIFRALGSPIMPMGWAKPVAYDPYNLRNPKKDTAIIAVAGPLANLLLAVVFGLLLKYFAMEVPLLAVISGALITVNVSLAVFNLVPVHPLDGSKILAAILPTDIGHEYEVIMHQYGMVILMLLILPIFGTAPINLIVSPVMEWVLGWML